MSGQGKTQILWFDTLTIVTNSDSFSPARINFNINPCRSRIQAVLEHFFNHRRGSLDDFTGGNLVGQLGA